MNGRVLLDTNIVIALFAGEPGVLEQLAAAPEVFIPAIAIGELYYGALRSGRAEANMAQIDALASDVWLPILAPSIDTLKLGQTATTAARWAAFVRKYRAEKSAPEARYTLALLAALSHYSNFSVGCYCENESHCHRSVLRMLLAEHGAKLEQASY